jgi:plastocyanin domain-containing protein
MSENQLSSRVNFLLVPLAALVVAGYGAFFLSNITIDQPGANAKTTQTTSSTTPSQNGTMTPQQMKMMVRNAPITGNAVLTDSGQAVAVKVDTGYDPNVITVKKGVPLTITFDRQSTFKCSGKVQFPSLSNVMTVLPDHGKAKVIVPIPNQAGQTVEFMCGMKMLKAKIITVD